MKDHGEGLLVVSVADSNRFECTDGVVFTRERERERDRGRSQVGEARAPDLNASESRRDARG